MKLSITTGNSKLGKIHNISLPPQVTCGNRACRKKCYAAKAWRMYPGTRKAWSKNLRAYHTDAMEYFKTISEYCTSKKVPWFRWHVAGDIPNAAYFRGMCMVAKSCPDTRFLCFTKNTYALGKTTPENLNIVYSLWPGVNNKFYKGSEYQEAIQSQHAVAVVKFKAKPDNVSQSVYDRYCKVTDEIIERETVKCNKKCDKCTFCWFLEPRTAVLFKEH